MTTIKSDPLRHYKAIKDVAEARKVLRDIHRRDLTEHDLRALRKQGPEVPFVWMLHPGGTHLMSVGARAATETNRSFHDPHMVVECFPEAAQGIYAWDGYSLRQLASAEEAERFLRLKSCTCTPIVHAPDGVYHPSPCPAHRL